MCIKAKLITCNDKRAFIRSGFFFHRWVFSHLLRSWPIRVHFYMYFTYVTYVWVSLRVSYSAYTRHERLIRKIISASSIIANFAPRQHITPLHSAYPRSLPLHLDRHFSTPIGYRDARASFMFKRTKFVTANVTKDYLRHIVWSFLIQHLPVAWLYRIRCWGFFPWSFRYCTVCANVVYFRLVFDFFFPFFFLSLQNFIIFFFDRLMHWKKNRGREYFKSVRSRRIYIEIFFYSMCTVGFFYSGYCSSRRIFLVWFFLRWCGVCILFFYHLGSPGKVDGARSPISTGNNVLVFWNYIE